MAKLWMGHQTRMAADLGVSQGTIANILAGRRKPGRVLLSALAAHPLINENWLREGVGAPLISEATGAGGEAALPIARQLFGGLPDDHPECLAELLHPVSRRLYRRSRYWIHIDGPEHPFARNAKLPVQVGDWVLMESDPENWPGDLGGKLCLSRIEACTGEELVLCVNDTAKTGSGTTVDFDFLGQLGTEIDDATSLCRDGRPLRNVELTKPQSKSSACLRRPPVRVLAVALHRCGDL